MSRMLNDMSISSASTTTRNDKDEVEVNPALERYLDPNQGPDDEDQDDDEGEIIDASAFLFCPFFPRCGNISKKDFANLDSDFDTQ